MRVLEIGLGSLALALFWAAGCVVVAGGLHLYRRADVMLGYGYGWKDAGVQLRATRRRRDGQPAPVSHRDKEKPSGPLADLSALKAAVDAGGLLRRSAVPRIVQDPRQPRHSDSKTTVVRHEGQKTGVWGGGAVHSDGSLWGVTVTPAPPDVTHQIPAVSADGDPPWSTAPHPAVTDETMTLQQPVTGSSDACAD